MESKNAEMLKEFTEFCQEHPNYRFWQALTNFVTAKGRWGYIFLATSNDPKELHNINDALDSLGEQYIFIDPYPFEGTDIPDAAKINDTRRISAQGTPVKN